MDAVASSDPGVHRPLPTSTGSSLDANPPRRNERKPSGTVSTANPTPRHRLNPWQDSRLLDRGHRGCHRHGGAHAHILSSLTGGALLLASGCSLERCESARRIRSKPRRGASLSTGIRDRMRLQDTNRQWVHVTC